MAGVSYQIDRFFGNCSWCCNPDVVATSSSSAAAPAPSAGSAASADDIRKALRIQRFGGAVNLRNRKDPWTPIGRAVKEIRKRRKYWGSPDGEMRTKLAQKGCNAYCHFPMAEVGDWLGKETCSWYELPAGHRWVPTSDQLLQMAAFELLEVEDRTTGVKEVTGDASAGAASRQQFELRRHLWYDLYESNLNILNALSIWSKGDDLPRDEDAPPEGRATSGFERDKGDHISRGSPSALAIKKATAASLRKRLQDIDFYSKLDECVGAPVTKEEEDKMYADAAFEEGEFFDD